MIPLTRNPAAALAAAATLLLAGCAAPSAPGAGGAQPATVSAAAGPATPDTRQLPATAHRNAALFQAMLRQRVGQDMATAALVIPVVVSDEVGQQLAVAFLDRLAADKLYMADLQRWLDTHDELSLEDLIQDWSLHHEETVLKSVEYLDHSDEQVLWRAASFHSIYELPRKVCQTLTKEQIQPMVVAAHHKLIADHLDDLARALARGYGKVLAATKDTGFLAVIGPEVSMTIGFMRKLEKTLPPEDGDRLEQNYSYHPGGSGISPQEACERAWIVSHAIADWDTSDGHLLLRNLLITEIETEFHVSVREKGGLARDGEGSRPKTDGFVAGDRTIHYPFLAVSNGVGGATSVDIAVDAQGKAGAVTIVKESLSPASVTSFDGTVFRTRDLFQAMFEHYFRAGAFPPKLVDGKPVPYTAHLETTWQMKQ